MSLTTGHCCFYCCSSLFTTTLFVYFLFFSIEFVSLGMRSAFFPSWFFSGVQLNQYGSWFDLATGIRLLGSLSTTKLLFHIQFSRPIRSAYCWLKPNGALTFLLNDRCWLIVFNEAVCPLSETLEIFQVDTIQRHHPFRNRRVTYGNMQCSTWHIS